MIQFINTLVNMKREHILCLFVVLVSLSTPVQAVCQDNSPVTTREVLSLDKGWRFHLGDIPFPVKVIEPLIKTPRQGMPVEPPL